MDACQLWSGAAMDGSTREGLGECESGLVWVGSVVVTSTLFPPLPAGKHPRHTQFATTATCAHDMDSDISDIVI